MKAKNALLTALSRAYEDRASRVFDAFAAEIEDQGSGYSSEDRSSATARYETAMRAASTAYEIARRLCDEERI